MDKKPLTLVTSRIYTKKKLPYAKEML